MSIYSKLETTILTFCLMFISLNVFGVNLIVKQDGSGDFTTIQAAINESQNYQNENSIIIVYPGVYSETSILYYNNNHSLLIKGTDKNNCIIDGFNQQNSLLVNLGNSTTVTLKNFTIRNGKNSGVKIGDYLAFDNEILPSEGNLIIDNCNIVNNGYYTNLNILEPGKHGAGIRCYGNLTLKNSYIADNHANYDDYPKERLGGGIYINNPENYLCTISNCSFKKNISGGGGAIYATGAGDIKVLGNRMDKDSLYVDFYIGNENGLACLFDNCTGNVDVRNNVITNHFYFIDDGTIGFPIVVFNNCPNATFCNNDIINEDHLSYTVGLQFSNSNNILIENNIFKFLWFNISGNGSYTVDYNYLQTCPNGLNSNVTLGQHNIFYPPYLGLDPDTYSLIWNSENISSLIDFGDPNLPLDYDGTRPDIGAKTSSIIHDNFTTKLYPNRVRWISFPVLDRDICHNGTEPLHVFTVARVSEFTDFFKIDATNGQSTIYSGQSWNNTINSLNSENGYFAKVNSYTEINVSGTKLPDDTIIHLHEGENYVGYFIKESMTIGDAFSDIWEHLQSVSGEDWAWVKNGMYPPERSILIYGKMYRVVVDADCDFQYRKTNPVPPKEREMTTGFSYQETASYVPINIANVEDPNILEIGVFADDVCIGASKVEELPVQILAYPQDGKGNHNISFEYYYGTKSYKKMNRYEVVNGNNFGKLDLTPFKMQTVKFTSKTNSIPKVILGNYPNPFTLSGSKRNMGTTIFFDIPQETNASLTIYNIKGQKVKNLFSGNVKAGNHKIQWNGSDDSNNMVSAGIYFYKLSFANQSKIGKMILLK